ncbi:MAG: aminotransferase class I/II-fold pyridoxal phosphate-dependent enzyme [Luteitalea sp.]|nr:aminotransferase class I/II-fold pyridoxal phosphate-dependent enzyme [Luteitalea sp.]
MNVNDALAIHGGTPAVQTPAPRWPEFDDRERRALVAVLESETWGGYHSSVAELESRMAAMHGGRFGIAVANGTVSLEIALAATGVGPGDEVIVPPISFVASATSIVRAGAVPVFADVDPETTNLDVERASEAITERTRAIVLVHFAGCPADLDAFGALCRERQLVLIEDCAHAPGAAWRGRPVGSVGAFGSFSFQASKNLTAGEGGMLITSDANLAERARSLMNQGRRAGGAWYEHVRLGTNARLTGFQAALLLAQLARLPEQSRRRVTAAARLRDALREIGGVVPTPTSLDPGIDAHAYHIFSMRLDTAAFEGATRADVIAALAAEGVPVTAGYPHPLYRNPLFDAHRHRVEPCPHAEAYCRDSIWLPHHALLAAPSWMDEVIRALRKVRMGAFTVRPR